MWILSCKTITNSALSFGKGKSVMLELNKFNFQSLYTEPSSKFSSLTEYRGVPPHQKSANNFDGSSGGSACRDSSAASQSGGGDIKSLSHSNHCFCLFSDSIAAAILSTSECSCLLLAAFDSAGAVVSKALISTGM